ncbi:MAG TPA: YdeI/OmpD-associated family protein [Gemmatimonadales bacterium]|nr:YdeI/OmpD-associated family protein [Gemmatimonadales bacterium]
MPAPKSFRSAAAFRQWLAGHPNKPELIVRCFKVHARNRGIGYREALDEALCAGWIDGVRHAFDADSFTTRFTPRRERSRWSAVNLRRYAELEAEGRVTAAGRAAFARRSTGGRAYSYEGPQSLGPEQERRLRANGRAWEFYRNRPPGYRRLTAHWVMEARKEETRERRLDILLACSERGEPIPALARSK